MDTVFRIVVQLTVIMNVMAFNFDGFMKNLPIPADIKAVIMDMHQKQQEFSMPDADGVTSSDFETGTPFLARKFNEMIKPTSTVMSRVVTKTNKPVTQKNRLLRSSVTLKPGGSCINMVKTTGKPPEKPLTSRPPFIATPLPMPVRMPIYASLPVILPMRTYFEKVEHDHPSLYKIKQMIEEDTKKWKEENTESDSEISVVVEDFSTDQSGVTETDADTDTNDDTNTDTDNDTDNDTNTDTDTNTDSSSLSEYSDAGPDYYDDLIRIKVGGRDR